MEREREDVCIKRRVSRKRSQLSVSGTACIGGEGTTAVWTRSTHCVSAREENTGIERYDRSAARKSTLLKRTCSRGPDYAGAVDCNPSTGKGLSHGQRVCGRRIQPRDHQRIRHSTDGETQN